MRGPVAILLVGLLVAGCRDAAPAPDAARPGSLSVSVGGSMGMSGAVVR